MFKFGTISAFKHVKNNPRSKAVENLKNGNVVIPSDSKGLAPAPATVEEAKGKQLHVVINIVDKPEVNNLKNFSVKKGEFVNAFNLADMGGLTVELDASVIDTEYTSIAVDDTLIPQGDGSGQWVKGDAEGYGISLKVIEKTTYFESGIYAVVVVN